MSDDDIIKLGEKYIQKHGYEIIPMEIHRF